MNRSRRERKRRQTIPVWSYPQAVAAQPYIQSIARSLRDHQLEAQAWELAANRLASQPGRPDRDTLIAQEEALRNARNALARYEEALQELNAIGICCEDALRGQLLLPFLHGEILAWFIFDLFDAESLRFWRYHCDPAETLRPISEALKEAGESGLAS